jgi:NADH-quinone oxidoreductase subunit J
MTTLLFYLFAALALGGGLGMILGRTPIASLLSLVASFFSLAAIYVLLQAHFVAAIQVIVYAGAIMVLFLFVIMLLNLGHDYRRDLREFGWIVAGSVVAGLTGYGLLRALAAEDVVTDMGGSLVIEAALRELNAVGAIAAPLFQTYLVPFELTSLLLLVAIVGAVLLAKRRV